jgi:hypothetical protein
VILEFYQTVVGLISETQVKLTIRSFNALYVNCKQCGYSVILRPILKFYVSAAWRICKHTRGIFSVYAIAHLMGIKHIPGAILDLNSRHFRRIIRDFSQTL